MPIRIAMPKTHTMALDFIHRPFGLAYRVVDGAMFVSAIVDGVAKFTTNVNNAVRFTTVDAAAKYLALARVCDATLCKIKIPYVSHKAPDTVQ